MSTTTGHAPDQEERQSASQSAEPRRETNLTIRYGSIGISAVAAALRYSTPGKNPAYAPVTIKVVSRLIEMAA